MSGTGEMTVPPADPAPHKRGHFDDRLGSVIIVIGGLALVFMPLRLMFAGLTAPRWSETILQYSLDSHGNQAWVIYGVMLCVFYVWGWYSNRALATGLLLLQVLAFAGYMCLWSVAGVGGGIGTSTLATLQVDEATYMLITRNVVGNGKLDLYRCINGRCRGREIAWDEWATYSGATLSVEESPRQLVVDGLGTICFDLDDFDTAMETYQTRGEAGLARQGWDDGCR